MKKLNVEVKINEAQFKRYQTLIQDLIASGYDLSLMNNQGEIWLYLPEGGGWSLVLNAKGTWRLE